MTRFDYQREFYLICFHFANALQMKILRIVFIWFDCWMLDSNSSSQAQAHVCKMRSIYIMENWKWNLMVVEHVNEYLNVTHKAIQGHLTSQRWWDNGIFIVETNLNIEDVSIRIPIKNAKRIQYSRFWLPDILDLG